LRAADERAWNEMRAKLWPSETAASRAEMTKLVGKGNFVALLAWHGDVAVGFAEATVRAFANGCESAPVPFLEGLWVAPKWRRQGAGRALVAGIAAWARRKGFRELGSDAYITARASHRAHRAYGFVETERVVYFRKKLR
jgi:aminoglycoside 6'-N-acetyltransferase I